MNGKTFELASGDRCTVAHDNGGRPTITVGAALAHLTREEAIEIAAEIEAIVDHLAPATDNLTELDDPGKVDGHSAATSSSEG